MVGTSGVFHDTKTNEYYFLLLKQLIDKGLTIGWNPYMNAGEPFYLISNLFLVPVNVIFIFLGEVLRLDGHRLFNLAFLADYLVFCSGSLLFLSAALQGSQREIENRKGASKRPGRHFSNQKNWRRWEGLLLRSLMN
jgi:hypothetical protein